MHSDEQVACFPSEFGALFSWNDHGKDARA
jgi:hypothetical protein